jgi:hypothetical protein
LPNLSKTRPASLTEVENQYGPLVAGHVGRLINQIVSNPYNDLNWLKRMGYPIGHLVRCLFCGVFRFNIRQLMEHFNREHGRVV